MSLVPKRLRWLVAGVVAGGLVFASTTQASHLGSLLLGHVNSASEQTKLQGSTAEPLLALTNGGGGYALAGNNNSGGVPAISGGNLGSGPGFRGVSVGGVGAYGLHTATSGTAAGARGDTSSTAPFASGVLGQVTPSSPGGFSTGVRGLNAGTGVSGIGVWGSQAGSGFGVYGTVPSGTGVFGSAFGTTGTNTGVRGQSSSPDGLAGFFHNFGNETGGFGDGVGLRALAGQGSVDFIHPGGDFAPAAGEFSGPTGVIGAASDDISEGRGVIGVSAGGVGVYGLASSTSGGNMGVLGRTLSPDGFAGWFSGRVHVSGDLSVGGDLTVTGAKSFKIDHPLAPAEKYLVHAAVESDEMTNVYSGTVTTDGKGFATVKLPAYVQAVNRDFRYQLTILGKEGWEVEARVWEEVSGNRFTIRTNKAKVKVSWQLTGTRNDAHARANPLVVEPQKAGAEKGRYLSPRAHGQPASRGIDALHAPAQPGRRSFADPPRPATPPASALKPLSRPDRD